MSGFSICCDFDGTICLPDSCECLLQRFAPPEWKDLDDAVWRREITEREAFPKQIELLRVTWDEARRALREGVRVREGFAHFVEFCRERRLPLVILSSGLRELIGEVLSRIGVTGIPVHAHGVEITNDRWHVIPWTGRRLAEHCSHCKCGYVVGEKERGRKVIYIGDGYTDLCPSPYADLLFATGRLAQECRAAGRPFIFFETFDEVERELDRRIHPEQDP
jgi:2-hydroxy-3-keto-5-methylthiopentenyl-1-phosphate phosphatase